MIIKILKRKFNSIKICAVFTTVCFMVSTLGANLYAIPMTENTNQKYENVFNKASSISNEYGKITSSKDAQSDITVINIQDLHCHPQTQRNIAKIIGQIADKYNLKKIYVEGGYGDIDVSWLGSIKDENIKKKIIEELIEEGILTGSEYYKLISNNDNIELKGIDERQLHQDNIKRLSLIIENQDKYKELSKKINKEISFLEQKYVNIRNKRFNNSIEDYLSGKIDTRRFYRQLLKYIKDINANPEEYNNVTAIRLEDYPNISKFMTLRKVSKNINVRDVTQQLQIVLNELKSRMPYNIYTRLLKETDNFSDSQKVVELITLLCEKEGIDLDRKYKALSEFLNSNEINRELNTVELVYEERQLITEIRKALSYNNEEYEITFVSDFSRYFQDYLEYKLTDADWKYFESEYKQFRQLYGKYATVDRIKEIESDIAELNKYYEINDQRNEIFVNNLLQDEEPVILQQSKLRQDEEILKQSKEVIIAVTGGFHSQALEEILQAKEVNTIVITPSIFEGIEKATKQYKGIIKEQSKEFQHQALAYTLASCSDSVVYKRVKGREQVPSDYAVVREEDDGSVVVAEHFQKRILLNAVVRILGTKDVAKIREVLEPVMGKEALTNLEEDINNLEDIGERFDAKYEPFRNAIDAAVDTIVDSIQTAGNLVLPDQATIDRAMTGLVTSLISVGQIYFSDGVIFEIENSEFYGKDLAGIPAEIYSRMMPTFQRALLLFQLSRTSTVPLNTSSLESDDKIVIVQPRQAADGKTETYDEELSLTVEDLLYIGLNDDNEWSFLTSESVRERTENLRERKRQTGLLSKAEKKLKENQVPNYTCDVVDLRIKLKKAQLNKQVVYLSDIFGRQVLIKRKDSNGNDVYCEAIIKYNEETRQWELVPFEEINARYKSIEDGLLSKIEDFTKQFEGKTPEEILKNYPAILQLVILAVVRGFDIDNTFLDNKTLTLGGVKGYFAEYLVKYFTETYLDDQYRLAMPIDSNQEGFDLIDKDGYRIQIKAAARRARATDELDIVGHALEKFKGIPVFATSEIAGEYKEDTDMVFSYGLSHDFIESIAKVAFDILDGLTDGEKSDLRNKAVGKTVETRYLSEFLKDKDLERRAQQERINDEKEEETIRGQRNQQSKAAIKTVDDYVYQCFIELFKSKLGIADEQVTMQPKLGVEEKTQQEEIQQEETATPKRSKLSIFDGLREKGAQTDFDKYFKDKRVVVQNTKTKSFEILEFNKKSIKRIIGRFDVSVSERDYDSLGITVEKDAFGNIISVSPKEGYEFSSLSIDGEPTQGKNLPFSVRQLSAMLRDSGILVADAADIREDEIDQYVADIYLDDSEEDLQKAMEEAIRNNKLMVIHVFRNGFSTKGLTIGQIRDKYVQAYSLLQRDKLKNLSVLSEITQLGKDVETESVITFDFFLKELLKNHFGHGNLGLFEYPMACYISSDGSKMFTYDSSLSLDSDEYVSPFGSEEFKEKGITSGVLEDLMKQTLIHGDGQGRNYMNRSLLRNFQDGRVIIDGLPFYRAEVTSKLETEEQKEAARQYKKEQDSKATKSAVTVATTAADWEDFWGMQTRDTVSRLYNRGLTKYLRQYLKQTGKIVENLTKEELSQIQKDAENYRFTFPGIFYGVVLETFALFSKGFIAAHGEMSFGMKIVVWTVRALSIGIGLTTAFLSVSSLPVSTILLAAAVPTIFATTTISSSFIIHLLWNIGAVLTNNKSLFSQPQEELIAAITPYLSIPKINGVFNTVGNHFSIEEKDAAGVERVDAYSKQILDDLKNGIINLPTDVQVSLIRLFNGEFNEKDNKVIHDYVFVGVRDSTTQDQREKYIKMFSVIYAYKTWEDLKRTNSGKIKTSSDGTEYIEVANNIILTFDNWVHICDAHCILTSGNEEVSNRYSSTRVAFKSAITLNMLIGASSLIDSIINNWDISQKRNRQDTLYIKRVGDTIYSLVVKYDSNKGYYVETFYVIDKYKYENDFFEVVLPSFIKQPSKPDLDNTIKNNNMGIIRIKLDQTGNIIGRNRSNVGLADSEVTIKGCSGFNYDGNPLHTAFVYSDFVELDDGAIAVVDNRNKKIKVFFGQDNEVIEYDISRFTSVTILGNGKIEVVDSNGRRVEFNTKYLSIGIAYSDDGRILLANDYTKKRTSILIAIGNIVSDCMKDQNDNRVRNQDDVAKILDLMDKFLRITYWGKKDGSTEVFTAIQNFFMDMINIFDISNLEKINELLKNDKGSLQIMPTSYQGVQDAIGTNLIKMKDIDMVEEFCFKLAENSDRTESKITEIANEVIRNHSGNAILPENMGLVNRIMQSKFGNAFIAATVIAFKELRASLEPNFEDLHQTAAGKRGAQQVANLANRYNITENDTFVTKIIKSVLGTIFKGASIVKHITIDYRYIKASGIQETISMFGNNTYMDEYGQIHIPPVMIIDDLQQVQGELIPTGISVNGRSIYQVAESGMLIYGAQGMAGVDVSKAINESQMIKDAIENMIRAKGYEGIKVEVEGVIQEEGEGVRFEEGITIIGTQELQGKSTDYVNGFVSSSLEIKRSMGVMYSQKALISLESIDDMEKLEQALKQGRARKIISKSQYEQLQLTPEEIITMRENGIEIYIDSNEIDNNLKENGIVGQIIRKDGQIFIHDYYAQEEVEVEEIGEEDSLLNIENKLVNSQKPILIDIKVLAKQFQKENILGVYKGLNTLIGNIKIKTGIGTINQADIENLAYNVDYNKIPELGTLSKEKLETLTIDELIEMLNIAENSEIRIILKAIRKNQNLDENGFVNIIKERILAKAVLKENNKEFGLKDKKMEILLGKMLLKQLGNQDKQNVNIPDSFTGEKDNVIKKIMEETEKAMKGDEVAVNTIIEIILVYGDSYKNKQMAKELDANDARNYRAMMAAA